MNNLKNEISIKKLINAFKNIEIEIDKEDEDAMCLLWVRSKIEK